MMVTGWVLYALAVSLLVTGAAWFLERGLARARLPTRWMWGAALFMSVAIPLAAFLPGRGVDQGVPGISAVGTSGGSGVATPAPRQTGIVGRVLVEWPVGTTRTAARWVSRVLDRGAGAIPAGPAVERWTIGIWLSGSGLLAVFLLVATGRMSARKRRWPRWELRNRQVRVAPEMGPAVVGVLRPEIVIPTWAVTLPPKDLELILAHEEEHLRARDPLLLAASLVPLLACPWNPAVWWKLGKLREAVEVDCDRRVLRRGATPSSYGQLLVRVGSRGHARVCPSPSISGSRPLLLKRLEAMRRRPARARIPVALAAGAGSLALVVVALQADTPMPIRSAEPVVAAQTVGPMVPAWSLVTEAPADEPGVLSANVGPEQPETASVVESVADPAEEPGEEAPTEPPSVDEAPIDPTGDEDVTTFALDQPAVEPEASDLEGLRARIMDEAAGLGLPSVSPPPQREVAPDDPPAPEVTEAYDTYPEPPAEAQPLYTSYPVPTSFEAPPDVRNRTEVQRALSLEYPSLLRDARVGGTVLIRFHVDERGFVSETLVERSSGYAQLDVAALRVAQRFEFTPVVSGEEAVPAWFLVPIKFQAE